MSSTGGQDLDSEPQRRPGGRTRELTERITTATLDLLVEEGYEAVTFAAVAERAGVGRATMYRRWASTAELVGEAIRRVAADEIRIRDLGSLGDDLTDVLTQIGAFITSPVGRAALAAGLTRPDPPSDATAAGWARRWADVRPVFDRAIARGELSAGVDADALFAAAAGAVYFRTLVMGEPVDRAWIARSLAAVLGA